MQGKEKIRQFCETQDPMLNSGKKEDNNKK